MTLIVDHPVSLVTKADDGHAAYAPVEGNLQ